MFLYIYIYIYYMCVCIVIGSYHDVRNRSCSKLATYGFLAAVCKKYPIEVEVLKEDGRCYPKREKA